MLISAARSRLPTPHIRVVLRGLSLRTTEPPRAFIDRRHVALIASHVARTSLGSRCAPGRSRHRPFVVVVSRTVISSATDRAHPTASTRLVNTRLGE